MLDAPIRLARVGTRAYDGRGDLWAMQRHAPWFRLNARTLETIDEPRVPGGYTLRTVRGEEDLAARVASHRAAWEGSRVTEESYRFVMRTRAYRTELDCVLEAPD